MGSQAIPPGAGTKELMLKRSEIGRSPEVDGIYTQSSIPPTACWGQESQNSAAVGTFL
jgi:hypothetical protein